jgi:accessory gene regulator B
MEKKAHEVAEKIGQQLNFSEEKRAVVAYGLIAIFEIFSILIIISVVGLLGHFFTESLIIFLGVGLLKKSTGGAHSDTMFGCIFISSFSISFLAMLSKYVFYFDIAGTVNIVVTAFIYTLCLLVFYIRVPVDSVNKPIRNPRKITKLRLQSVVLLTLYTALSVLIIVLTPSDMTRNSILASLRLAILWQTTMITSAGIRFIKRIDFKI